jgi:RNA polymerase sigma-70 factor (ECF subfamily)
MDQLTPDSEETQRLLEEARTGDPQAFDRLFGRHRASLREVIDIRMDPRLRARMDPSDVVQETHLEAFRRLADYLERRPMPFRLWLRKTAHERLYLLQRRHIHAARRATEREVPLPDRSSLVLAERLLASGSAPAEHLSREERARLVRQALNQLAEMDREILLMRNFENLSYQEVSHLLDIDAAAARKRHGRALIRLHKILSEGGLTESNL